jgi:hypothetical protein
MPQNFRVFAHIENVNADGTNDNATTAHVGHGTALICPN